MRIFRGSQATLAPEMDYDYTCSIELLRTLTLNSSTEEAWKAIVIRIFNVWRAITDKDGRKGKDEFN
jgi:hypothetical protein